MPCQAINAKGEPCGSMFVTADGFCAAHRPGGEAAQLERARLGGQALRAKLAGAAFTPEDLPPIGTLEDAKLALDAIRVAVLCRRITHAEGNAAAKAIDSWVKAEGAASTARIVGELRGELEAKTAEITALRRQVEGVRPFKVSSK